MFACTGVCVLSSFISEYYVTCIHINISNNYEKYGMELTGIINYNEGKKEEYRYDERSVIMYEFLLHTVMFTSNCVL